MNSATVGAGIGFFCLLVGAAEVNAQIVPAQCASAVIDNFSASPNPINPVGQPQPVETTLFLDVRWALSQPACAFSSPIGSFVANDLHIDTVNVFFSADVSRPPDLFPPEQQTQSVPDLSPGVDVHFETHRGTAYSLIGVVTAAARVQMLGTFHLVELSPSPIDFGTQTLELLSFGTTLVSVGVPLVPEPETYAMLIAGLGLLGFATRRKAKLFPKSGAPLLPGVSK